MIHLGHQPFVYYTSLLRYNRTGSQASFPPPLFRQPFTPPPPTSSYK